MFFISEVYATSDSNWYSSNGPGVLALDLGEHLGFLKACVQRGCLEAEFKERESLTPGAGYPPRADELTFFFDGKARWFRYDDRCEKFHGLGSTALIEKLPSYMDKGETEIEGSSQAEIRLLLTDPRTVQISCSLNVSENEVVKIYIPSQSIDSFEQAPIFDWKLIEDVGVLAELEEAGLTTEKKRDRRRTASPGNM